MERDCTIAHGMTEFLKERLHKVSDPFQITICEKCGFQCTNMYECVRCKTNRTVSCNMPFASKLLLQELTALGLKLDIYPEQI